MKSARELYTEIYGTPPDTMSADYRLFCLALYLCSKARNKNASEEHKQKIIKKTPSVLKYVEEDRANAERNNKQFENSGIAQRKRPAAHSNGYGQFQGRGYYR